MAHNNNTASQLCSYCEQIPLDIRQVRQTEANTDGGKPQWNLGTVGRIKQSRCNLCRFVCLVLYEHERTSRSSERPWRELDTKLYLRWVPGRFGSKCFVVDNGEYPIDGPGSIEIYYLQNSTMDFRVDKAFCLMPNIGQTLDFRRIRAWIDWCNVKHAGPCKRVVGTTHYGKFVQDIYPKLNFLRFIDVREQCIVETNVVYPYVALSYIWGLAVSLRLTSLNKTDLTQPKALQKYSDFIPRTISDAIILVQRIGERYLWCDAFCLLQNDPDDVKRGVKTMDLIYENAELTIVAACGHDADAGLPGVFDGTRLEPRFSGEIIPGVELGGYMTLDERMRRSVYRSRGWTFQEELLSKRCLFFIDELVYFRCRSTTLFELLDPALDRHTTKSLSYDPTSMLPMAIHMEHPSFDFLNFIEYYTQRSLTNQEDALDAMGGIIQRLSRRMKCRFLQGLPTAIFDIFILFAGSSTSLRRRHGFPSYSWAGWNGTIWLPGFLPHENKWLDERTWIVWYRRSPSGVLNLVWDILANEDFPHGDDEYLGYRKRRQFHSPVTLAFPTIRTQPTECLDHAIPVLNYEILQFWTLSAFFNIRITNNIINLAFIIDGVGAQCGALFLDDQEGSAFLGSTKPYEFIAVSEIDKSRVSEWPKDSYSHELKGLFNTEWYYNVILLVWSNGLAERRGFGFIRQEDFITKSLSPGVSWKEILLS